MTSSVGPTKAAAWALLAAAVGCGSSAVVRHSTINRGLQRLRGGIAHAPWDVFSKPRMPAVHVGIYAALTAPRRGTGETKTKACASTHSMELSSHPPCAIS